MRSMLTKMCTIKIVIYLKILITNTIFSLRDYCQEQRIADDSTAN